MKFRHLRNKFLWKQDYPIAITLKGLNLKGAPIPLLADITDTNETLTPKHPALLGPMPVPIH